MSKPIDFIKSRASAFQDRITSTVDYLQGHHRLVRADFHDGGKTMYNYLRTHRNRYNRHVGARFLMRLYEAGPDILAGFADRQRDHGWHFRLTDTELEALCLARDTTCTRSRIAGLRYSTNVFNQVANRKQLARMLGLGAVAGSAGLLLGLSELFFFAKEYSKDFLENTLGIRWFDPDSNSQNDEFIALANQITDGAVNPDGSLDAVMVADRIADLVESLEESGSAQQALSYMNADTSYIIGVISGIILLVVGRGIIQLVIEGFAGTVSKIDALVHDMDEYCEWKLGRSPFPSDIDPARLEDFVSSPAPKVS